ncbi:glycogen debranching N-terminal domain-containing protein [Jiangella sp. DSM 45060]|uniref:glycogen debranching N-terminal domain-containing protein n=1 Tax=Jiangella sp. DSM 45060 TaxID=1798224 RepID=UPI000B886CE3|nr:glycogen debranching N-terminal domain-containing protein [Jiangella sp. DSM 45060]
MTAPPVSGPVPQPFLHDLVSCVKAPTVALSGADGQLRAAGAQGVLSHDRRVLSELRVDVDGHEPEPAGHGLRGAGHARFTGIVRHLGDAGADPTVRLERQRFARADGVTERLELVNNARVSLAATVHLHAAADFAPADAIKRDGAQGGGLAPTVPAPGRVEWDGGELRTTLTAAGATVETHATGAVLSWAVELAPRSSWTADVTVTAAFADGPPPNAFAPADAAGWDAVTVTGRADLARLAARSVDDLEALALADPLAPGDAFLAAGSPWFFTLFGRDSLWAARFTLPLGTGLARGTLRTLARRQGTTHDPDTAEAPGKILHEVRIPTAGSRLPPVYFGTVDATALWVCLLHDAWRWGLDAGDLLDPLEAALRWLTEEADPDGDGFLEYVDSSGRGLANQGWKDSGDSIQYPDGAIAEPPIALSEAQAYAHEAALAGASLLDAHRREGGDRFRDWAAALRERFAAAFWVSDEKGRFPAIALDGAKRPVGTVTSNLGHLLGTGLLGPDEAAVVADRLGRPDLDTGYGLRTMSADATGFNPLGYHAGSIWPHDTAIAVRGLAADGFPGVAASLADGLLRVAPDFAYRLPELFAGTDARAGEPVLAYPAACRPQAWSAATVLALLQAALGLTADVPGGRLRVAPDPAFAGWFPLRVEGLRVAGHPLTVAVDAEGRADVSTSAPLTVETA